MHFLFFNNCNFTLGAKIKCELLSLGGIWLAKPRRHNGKREEWMVLEMEYEILQKKTLQYYNVLSSVQSLSHVWLFTTPWTAAHQASLSITNSQSLLKLKSIDAIQQSPHLSSSSPSTFNLSQHQRLSKWVSSSHQVAKVLEFQLQHQSFQWIFRIDLL